MPFHSGEGTNGIPAASMAAGGEHRPPRSFLPAASAPRTHVTRGGRLTRGARGDPPLI